MTKKYYLRVEGVNLSNFVYDTQDLSTIRGGGLRLLDSVEEIESKFNNRLSAISTGASSGLFEINASTFDDAEDIKKQVEDYINHDACLKHATFVVDILESGGENFAEDREKLLAVNRWRQMQSPSIAVPSRPSGNPCRIDMVRPAAKVLSEYKDENDVPVSESAYYRRKYGLDRKQSFYERLAGIKSKFVHDLNELTSDTSRGNLHHKMAVIYIDGNRFGAIQEDTKTQDELKNWDDKIKNYRKQMLTKILKETVDKPEWTNGDKHRMETLLWGGDELIWVVPAWVGWWTLEFFYQHSQDWCFNERPLKHAAGIVFCHHNAPIHRIKALAEELAGLAKSKSRDESFFVYQKLESFDHIGKGMRAYIRYAYHDRIKPCELVLKGEKMREIAKNIRKLRGNEFPRGRLYKIVQCILSGQGDVDVLVKESIKNEAIEESLERLAAVLNGKYVRWFHIAELWDYVM